MLSDAAIMGGNSELSSSIAAYRAQGMTEQEAKKQAYLDRVGQVAWAGAGGALSGLGMGGGAGTLSLANSYNMPSSEATSRSGGFEAFETNYNTSENANASEGFQEATAGTETAGRTDHTTLVSQVRNAIPQMQDMQPVANVTGNEIPAGNSIVDRLTKFVDSFNGKVTRNGFGDVIFSRARIKSGVLGHGTGQAKFDTFAAVPAVIKYGTQIGYAENYAGRNYDSYVFAAPIEYKNNTSYLGVIVTKDAQDGRYYVHEVIDGEGGLIYADKMTSGATIQDTPNVVPGRADSVAAPDGSRNDMGGGSATDTSYPASAPATGSNLTQGAGDVNGNLPSGHGAMSPVFEYREAQNQTKSSDLRYRSDERETDGLRAKDRTHQVSTVESAKYHAQERYESDYEGEKAALFDGSTDPTWGIRSSISRML